MATSLFFQPGLVSTSSTPLGRYVPRLPTGVATSWLKKNIPSGSWVIDPFGASPQLAVEAAQAGYRILVAANNPIARFMIEMAATPPSADEIQSALASLATSKRGEERLEPHIRSLYNTQCDSCGGEVSADSFLWEREAVGPYARIYTCPHCHHLGEFPATETDIEKAARFTSSGMHRSRALERVASTNDPNREHVEEALDAYLPRAVYALFTLINKLEGLSISEPQRDMLSALALSACDQANTLWRVPEPRARPKQLTIPQQFQENNIWMALENAIPIWASPQPATHLAIWPQTPPQDGGICLFEGRMKNLAEQLGEINFAAVVSALPRPNQAFWTLSALWAGWLWGREALGPFGGVLRRRRYDWAWHTTALESTLQHLAEHLAPNTPFFGMVTENEAGFDASAMVAADLVGFKLEGVTLRQKSGQTQLLWRKTEKKTPPSPIEAAPLVQTAAQEYLSHLGEPAHYLKLQAASLQALAKHNRIFTPDKSPADIYSETRTAIEFGLTYRSGFSRYGPSEHSIEVGQWWPRDIEETQPSLADRVEKEIVNFLIDSPNPSFQEVDTAICEIFPGLEVPEETLMTAILESYARKGNDGRWQLRENDTPQARKEDILDMGYTLTQLGELLGYVVETNLPSLSWRHLATNENLHFYIIASAVTGELVFDTEHKPKESLIVIPGGRSKLALYKMERDPRLGQEFKQGWRFLKYRSVRRLWENTGLERENLAAQIALDPISIDDPQMPLL